MNIHREKKNVIRKLDKDRKWTLLVQNLSERLRWNNQDVQTEITKLKESPDKEYLSTLSASLRSRNMRWMSSFIDQGGLGILLDNLNKLVQKKIHNNFEQLYILCLKSVMNNKVFILKLNKAGSFSGFRNQRGIRCNINVFSISFSQNACHCF